MEAFFILGGLSYGVEKIKAYSHSKQHFAQCNNASCQSIFPVNIEEPIGIYGFLCERCQDLIGQNFQIIQCASCKTILQITPPIQENEGASYLVEKCTHCTGSEEDEAIIEPLYNFETLI